jgi:hypothetical protein
MNVYDGPTGSPQTQADWAEFCAFYGHYLTRYEWIGADVRVTVCADCGAELERTNYR